jgi:hypothetical protein
MPGLAKHRYRPARLIWSHKQPGGGPGKSPVLCHNCHMQMFLRGGMALQGEERGHEDASGTSDGSVDA